MLAMHCAFHIIKTLTPPTIEIVGFLGGSGKAYHHAAYVASENLRDYKSDALCHI